VHFMCKIDIKFYDVSHNDKSLQAPTITVLVQYLNFV
jgi:hypothetical protein